MVNPPKKSEVSISTGYEIELRVDLLSAGGSESDFRDRLWGRRADIATVLTVVVGGDSSCHWRQQRWAD